MRAAGAGSSAPRSAGVVLAALTWSGHTLAGEWITFGPGYVAVDWLFAASHPVWLMAVVLAVRAAATLTCVYGGGGGGVFTALATCGAFIGQLVAALVHDGTGVYPLLGAACFLGAGYRLPVGTAMLDRGEQRQPRGLGRRPGRGRDRADLLMGEESVSDAKAATRAAHRAAASDARPRPGESSTRA